jgi:hypothetical protein
VDSPASETAVSQHIDKLVTWCWSISQVAIDEFGENNAGDVASAVQDASAGAFIQNCNNRIVNKLSDPTKFPKPPAAAAAAPADAAAEVVEHTIESLVQNWMKVCDMPIARKTWLDSIIDDDIFQSDEGAKLLQEFQSVDG